MIEIRSHGRGGQGAITSARVLAYAAVKEGRFGLASQTIQGDRRGAPVTAFTRISDAKIVARCPIIHPDYLIVLDPTLILALDLESDLKPEGEIVINAAKDLGFKHKTTYVDATSISLKYLGRPVVNTAMLGAFAAATGIVRLDSVVAAAEEMLAHRLDGKEMAANTAAIREAYEEVIRGGVHPGRHS